MAMKPAVWFVPVHDDAVLIYAPFHGISTLVNQSMADVVSLAFNHPDEPVPEGASWIRELREERFHTEERRNPPDPLFLGLILTRKCGMRCRYCDFPDGRKYSGMTFEQIKKAVDGYAEIMRGKDSWNIHLFGGEPFAAFPEAVFSVNYARHKAKQAGAAVHFETTTNGYYPTDMAYWIAEHIDTVVLSLDGFPNVQDRHRPGAGASSSAEVVFRNAEIFASGSCELMIRSCVSAENVHDLPQWAEFLAERFFPETVCFEPLVESTLSRKNGLLAPELSDFVHNWTAAYRILKEERIPLIFSSGDIHARKNSLCPLGRDALIVSPDGVVGSCWQISGADPFCFGTLDGNGIRLDAERMEQVRAISRKKRENCRDCFCYAHCAGGCARNQERMRNFCEMTRSLTLWQILESLGAPDIADSTLPVRGVTGDGLRETKLPPVLIENNSGDGLREAELSPSPIDAYIQKGWLRTGETYVIVDTILNNVKVINAEYSLSFQLAHSGLSATEAQAVQNALQMECD